MTWVPSRVASPQEVGDEQGIGEPGPVDQGPDDQGGAGDPSDHRLATDRLSAWVVVGMLIVLVVPLLTALAAFTGRWYPVLDLAITELRVRDVGTRDTPLIGLPGRIGEMGADQGSHPGPLSFWLLAPVYRLLGSDAWSLQAATVALHALAMGAALFIARRRGGLAVVLGVVLLLSVLTRTYGADPLTQPWNPYLPLLWWVVLLLAAWSVLDGDVAMLAVGVFAGSLCAQTHAPYMLIVLGVGGLAVVGAVNQLRAAPPAERRRLLLWIGTAVAVGALLWAPPVYDQLRREPGNLALLIEHFGSPSEETVGGRLGVEVTLLHLDPWRLVTAQGAAAESLLDGSARSGAALVPGLLLVLAWGATVVVAWRMRHRSLLRLHLVVGIAALLGVVSVSRIFGQTLYYLLIWAWGTTAVLLLAAGWTVAAFVVRRSDAPTATARRAGTAVLAGAAVVSTVVFAFDASDTSIPAESLSNVLAEIVPDAVVALEGSDRPGLGPNGRYLVAWSDSYHMGSQGMGLVNELDREGLDVGVLTPWRVPMTRHRERAPHDATALVQLVTGANVARWRAKPAVQEIAFHDPRTADEVGESERLRLEVIDELQDAGLGQLVVDVDRNLFLPYIDQRVPPSTREKVIRMLDLGAPTAIFVGPVEARD